MRTDNNWEITGKRFVAFFDILGFKDKVMREPHEKIYNDLAGIQVETTDKLYDVLGKPSMINLFGDSDIDVVKFSDTIVVFAKNDSIENFILFLISARFLFTSFLKKGFPLKGAIAYGEISVDKERQLYLGQPIIDAFLLEEDVNYIGVVAHNSIDRFQLCMENNNKFHPLLRQLLFEAKSPLKSGFITHFNLNWFRQLLVSDEKINEKTEKEDIKVEIIKGLKEYYLNVSGSPRRYIDNTIEFIDKNKNKINFSKITLP